MSSDLERFRDHARRMERAEHGDSCGTWSRSWRGLGTHRPDSRCGGCVPDGERVLWAQLAGEIDAYFAIRDAIAADDQPMLGDS